MRIIHPSQPVAADTPSGTERRLLYFVNLGVLGDVPKGKQTLEWFGDALAGKRRMLAGVERRHRDCAPRLRVHAALYTLAARQRLDRRDHGGRRLLRRVRFARVDLSSGKTHVHALVLSLPQGESRASLIGSRRNRDEVLKWIGVPVRFAQSIAGAAVPQRFRNTLLVGKKRELPQQVARSDRLPRHVLGDREAHHVAGGGHVLQEPNDLFGR